MTDLGGYRDIRARLRNPPGGRTSSELDIVPGASWERAKFGNRPVENSREIAKIPVITEQDQRALYTELFPIALEVMRAALADAGLVIATELAKQAADPPEPKAQRQIMIVDVIRAVAAHYNVPVSEIISDRRTAGITQIRHIAMYIARKVTLRSLPEIGRRMGHRDHTTIFYGCEKIEKMIIDDAELAAEIEQIKSQLYIDHGWPTRETAK